MFKKKESFISWLTLGLDLSQNQENFPLGKGRSSYSKSLRASAIKNSPYAECTEIPWILEEGEELWKEKEAWKIGGEGAEDGVEMMFS